MKSSFLCRVSVIIFLVSVPTDAQADGKMDFLDRFSSVPDIQVQRFVSNRKIVVVNKSYKLDVFPEGRIERNLVDEWTMHMINDAFGNRKSEVLTSKKFDSRIGRAVFTTKDIFFVINSKDGSYSITDFSERKNNEIMFLGKNSTVNQPVMSFDARLSLQSVLLLLKGTSSRTVGSLMIQSVTNSTFQKKPAICVTALLEGPATVQVPNSAVLVKSKVKTYFDEANAHAYLGTVAVTEAGIDYPRAHTRYDLIEYHTLPVETHPLPKRYTRYLEFDGEPKLLDFETDYTSYEKCVPDPEEFKLEKKYGLTTPVGPEGRSLIGKPGFSTGGRSWTWIYLLAAGVLLAGFIVYFVRKRRLKA